MRHTLRWVRRIAVVVLALGFTYLAVTFVQVWLASRRDDARPVQAIIVLGAAQYNGVPSPVLKARLDHAADLYHQGVAPVVVVTGGNQPGDRFTEAAASASYLAGKGVPGDKVFDEAIKAWQTASAASAG